MPTQKASGKKKIPKPAATKKIAAAKRKPIAKTAPKSKAAPAKPARTKAPAAKIAKLKAAPTKAAPVKAAPLKAARKPEAKQPARLPSAKPAAVPQKKTAEDAGSDTQAKMREKIYAELFGPSHPKGRGLHASGEPITSEELASQGWCILQFPPRPGRLSWIYATHGLSTVTARGKKTPLGIELVMHAREKDTVPLQVLSDAVKYILESGHSLAPGEIISDAEGVAGSAAMVKHFLAFDPVPSMPGVFDVPGGNVRPVVLLGISDAEMEFAAKVRAELADGRIVLMEALRAGGVFPVTDPKRQCLTRRRDFLRIWETAFRGVRERQH